MEFIQNCGPSLGYSLEATSQAWKFLPELVGACVYHTPCSHIIKDRRKIHVLIHLSQLSSGLLGDNCLFRELMSQVSSSSQNIKPWHGNIKGNITQPQGAEILGCCALLGRGKMKGFEVWSHCCQYQGCKEIQWLFCFYSTQHATMLGPCLCSQVVLLLLLLLPSTGSSSIRYIK